MFPYIIAIARPDWKRPYCEIITDVANNKEKMFELFDNFIIDEMLGLSVPNNNKFVSYSEFHDAVFSECYMHQQPIEIKYFINGMWKTYQFETMKLYNEKYNELTAPIIESGSEEYEIEDEIEDDIDK
jgi:hypothetical protein